jgi:hypothetical protein
MGLFGNRADHAVQDTNAGAEAGRLAALNTYELAEELMGAFAPGGIRSAGVTRGHGVNVMQLVAWQLRDFPRSAKYATTLLAPTREALGVLEKTWLVQRIPPGGPSLSATELGEAAIADGCVATLLAA